MVHERIHEAIDEVSLWLSGHNKETSCGIRLTMWLIALRLFSLHPLQGYADHHLSSYFTDPYISKIGTPVALFTMQYVGPHNDLLQNMVLAGLFGLAAVLLVTFVPLILFLRIYWNNQNVQAKKACVQGLCLVIGIFVGGLFSILLGLKMSITFYAVTVYALLATALWQQQKIK
jgi:O-antigen ligase